MDRSTFSRRSVLRTAGVAAASLPLLSHGHAAAANSARAIGQPMPGRVNLPTTPQPTPTEGSVGVAIVGLGGYALRNMMPAFATADGVHIAGVVSGNPSKAARVATAYGLDTDQIYSYDNFDTIASDDRVHAVYIVLPSGLHAEWAKKAFKADKHVLCEKPMALSPAECEQMIAASEKAQRKLMIGYRCHFEPFNLRAMELAQSETIGPIRNIRTAHQYRAGPQTASENWRFNRALAGGGPLEDYGIYGVQAALYLSGEMPESVSASTVQPTNDPRFTEIYAATLSQFNFPSGATAQLSTSYDAHGLNALEVYGSNGALLMQPATGYGGQQLRLLQGRDDRNLSPGDPTTQFAAMLEHFGDAVRTDAPILTGGDMGLRDCRLMAAIYRSSETGRSVRLRPDGRMR